MLTRFAVVALLTVAWALACGPPWMAAAQDKATVGDAEALGIALEEYPYPWPVHFLPLSIEGQDVRMAYMDVPPATPPSGSAIDAPAIILLHGKNFGGYYWAETARSLSAAGYRVVIPDQIGWGKSSKPDIRYSFQ